MRGACHINGTAVRVMGLAAALLLARTAPAQDDVIDRIDDRLAFGAWNESVRVRVSGTLDLEGYALSPAEQGLIFSERSTVFNPRLSLFADGQIGAHVYAFAQARADNGFDPGESGQHVRLDEYVVRLTPWNDGRFNLQVGKFATLLGNWTARHGSWENPFVTAPLPYENLTGIWDTNAVRSVNELKFWAGVLPAPDRGGNLLVRYRNVPVVWGPSYARGAAIFGRCGKIGYALEVKNASLSSRPETWSPADTRFGLPTFTGRIGYSPDEMWTFGVSASSGPYLRPGAGESLPPGRSLSRYREVMLAEDVSFAWHHVQLWAEAFEIRFQVPGVGNAGTDAYYVEAKYKVTPQFYCAVRWNQQLFSTFPAAAGRSAPWSRDTWRIDLGPGYRFTPHTQLKVQYSLEHQDADLGVWGSLLAVQLTTRF